ncbi:MAG TPA: hypothetical protein VIT83_02625 [Gammaproteobacteria bacterium]
MLSITDEQGIRWDVIVGKESFGAMVFLFSRADSDIVLRHAVSANSRLEAEQSLRDMSLDELRSLLRDAATWTPSAAGNNAP